LRLFGIFVLGCALATTPLDGGTFYFESKFYDTQIKFRKDIFEMRKLWQDIRAHKRAAMLFLVYWLATLVVILITWDMGIPFPVVLLLFTVPLIAGILVGLWRSSTPEHTARFGDKIGGGMLAGLLCTELTFLVMKGGIVEELIVWMQGGGQRFGEMLVFCIVAGVFGIILGFTGAAVASIIERFRNRLTRASS
jgi:uncharacterized membrane protein YbhN (UPF0104 family)